MPPISRLRDGARSALGVFGALATCALGACSVLNSAAALPDGGQKLPRTTDVARYRDPASDRGLATPHAETLGAETGAFDLYELVFLGMGFSPTRDTQFSVVTVAPFAPDPLIATTDLKWVFLRSDRVVAALHVQGALHDARGAPPLTLVGGGVLADIYLDEGGYLALYLGVQAGYLFGALDAGRDRLQPGLYLLAQLGFAVTLGDGPLRALTETWLPAGYVGDSLRAVPFAFMVHGLRLYSHTVAVDFGWLHTVNSGSGLDSGVPWLSVGSRL